MIKIDNFEINSENVSKAVSLFRKTYLPRLEKLYIYYSGENNLKEASDRKEKEENLLPHPYARYITTLQTGYFMGKNVKHTSSNMEYLKVYQEILDDNFEEDINFELAKSQSIFGYSAEIIYMNENAKIRFKKLDTRECIFIFGNSLDEFLHAVIRYYKSSDLFGNIVEYAEVYTDFEKIIYKRESETSAFKFESKEEHHFQEIPIILYKNNEEMRSDFESILHINDGYDKAQSNTANEDDYFNNAYLVVSGASGLEDIDNAEDGNLNASEEIKQKRVMFFPENGGAKFLTKDVNDTASENYKKRLNQDIHKFSMTPDLGDEHFAGNLSGVAIKFKTIPLEQNAKPKENKFRTGLKKRRELISYMLNIKKGTNYDYREITEVFTRNLPTNAMEDTQRILALAPYISKRTILELLPEIIDVDDELSRLGMENEFDKREYEVKDVF